MAYTDVERRLLALHFSELEAKEHADIYLVQNLPPEVAATLNGVYSRSHKSMRDNFLDRLVKGLAEQDRSLDDLEFPEPKADLLTQVMADKSGRFLKTYAIDHGHNSLREGSVVHIAVENVSQLVTRFIQRERRCSFEESSTRYISFSNKGHWRDPEVMDAGGQIAAAYEEILTGTFDLYQQMSAQLLEHLQRVRPMGEGEKRGPYLRALRAEAFDAARYLLTPAIHTKWGMVIDARTLSDMITGLLSHPLTEFQIVGRRLKEQGDKVLRNLLLHAKSNPYLEEQHRILPELAGRRSAPRVRHRAAESQLHLLARDPDLDNRLLASLLFEHSTLSFEELRRDVAAMGDARREEVLARALRSRGPHDAMPTGLEGAAPFEFELLVDFGAYRDIGRHRKGFQQQQMLTVEHGYLVPPLICEAGLDGAYEKVLNRVADCQAEVAERFPQAAGYVTPFAFLQRVRILFDPRQVDYFVELRSGPEGHFAYRKLALDMLAEVRRVSPLFAGFIRAQEGRAFLGRMEKEQSAETRLRRRMENAGDLPAAEDQG
jgi:thymidylate synthase ThyX